MLDEIIAEAGETPDIEVCGLLLGRAERISRYQAARNVAADPASAFELDPGALVAALRGSRNGGDEIVGWYHSHPSRSAVPSPRDLALAAEDARVWLIVAGQAARAWRKEEGRFLELEIHVEH